MSERGVERTAFGDLLVTAGGDAGALAEARAVVADAALVHHRSLPTRAALTHPEWAHGLRVDRTLGPFRDAAGRDTWLDVFSLVRQVRFVRSGGGAPFLTLPLVLVDRLAPHVSGRSGGRRTYRIPRGSLWFASALLAADAPASSYTGLRHGGGSLRLDGPITISGDEVIVPAGVAIEVDVSLTAEAPPGGTGPGADARAARITVPERIVLRVASAGATLQTTGNARLRVYGADIELDVATGPPRYVAELRALAVPLTPAAGAFDVGGASGTLFGPADGATIADAAWALPVATVEPTRLGDASGVGGLALWLTTGLSATWIGHEEAAALGPAVLRVDEHRVEIVASDVRDERYREDVTLGTTGDLVTLRWAPVFPLTFVSDATGSELVLTSAALDAALGLPVDVRGERLTVRSTAASVAFIATDAGTFLSVQGALSRPPSSKLVAFGLVNGVLRATPPDRIVLYARRDADRWASGGVALLYHLLSILPSLPDPYAASYGSLRGALAHGGGSLLSVATWDDGDNTFAFVLPESPPELGGSAGRRLETFAQSVASAPALVRRDAPDLWKDAAKSLAPALRFEREGGLILLDVSTSADQFGIGFTPRAEGRARMRINDLDLEVDGRHLVLLTLPAVQWEAVETISDPDASFPPRLGFATSGLPTTIEVPTVSLVPAHPRAALRQLLETMSSNEPVSARARFTLPFGIIAQAWLRTRAWFREYGDADSRWTTLSLNRPKHDALVGARQLQIDAVDEALSADSSPSFDGFTVQLPLGQPGGRSVLGSSVTTIFNTYLGAGGARPLVPVVRLDLSGYGETLFSDWRNPYGDPVAVVQARFDVLVGRTAYEVIQVQSFLFPYAVKVVRTITMERRNNAVVTRTDSGWVAVGDGVYDFPGTPIETHPGVVRRITNVGHIRETGQVLTIDGKQLAAVYFDGDLELDGAPALVDVKGQFGFVQLTAGSLIDPATYEDLIAAAGSLGGPLDTRVNLGGGRQGMELTYVDVGVTVGLGGPEFVMTAWGSLAFPGGGQWSVLRVDDPGGAPDAVPRERGTPLIRAGLAGTPPAASSPYRFADARDLSTPDTPQTDYGIVHATGTQRLFFARPRIDATDTSRITSTRPPVLADPFVLATAQGPFPTLDKTIPFPAPWALRVDANGDYELELPSSTFPAGVGRRTLRQAGSVKGDVDYTAATVTYELDTSAAVPWRFRLEGAAKVMNTTGLGDVIRLEANVAAEAGTKTVFTEPVMKMGGSLSFVQDLLTILADLGITGVMNADMTNDWSLKVALKVPVVDALGEPYQIPPAVPTPDIKFDDTEVSVELNVLPALDSSKFQLQGQPMFTVKAIPGLYVVAIIQFSIEISTSDGTTYTLLLGVGVAYEIEAGPFSLKGLFALTFFGFIGDTALGFGIGFLLKLGLDIAIVSIEISLEGKLAVIRACSGTANETLFGAAKLTFGVEISICLVLSISFEVETTASEAIEGPGEPACALPDVL